MKRNNIILIAIILGLALSGCKKNGFYNLTPKIVDDKVEVTVTTATFSWTVDWPGKLVSVVEVSESEAMADSRFYGSEEETNNHDFTVLVTDLEPATNYYYRFLVWNRNFVDDKFVMEVKNFYHGVVGIIDGLFTINADGDQVYFSQGNLQYQASTNTWRFAEHQYDYIGDANSNISSSYSGWIDLFGWGTSGWNCGNTYYRPWDSNNSNGSLYGPSGQYNLTGSYANSDWGHYNAISNGGNTTHQWRTLTQGEWDYVFNTRSTNSGIRYAKAQVAGVNGVVLLPDNWTASIYALNNTNSSDADFTSNTITATDWANVLEANGAVFLPAAGTRDGTSVYDAGSYGYYWSSSCSSSSSARDVDFGSGYLYAGYSYDRLYGFSVRLVRSAQ